MSQFVFKEIDSEGLQTLDVISSAINFNKWMYDTIRPYCKGKILEIGSGIGNISEFFAEAGANIVLSDIRDNYCGILKDKFSSYKNVGSVEKMDLVDKDFDTKFASSFNSFDTIFALNVVEHIGDDVLAIENCYKLLKKDGNLIILVPAYQFLYNKMDKELEHYRRYTISSLSQKMSKNFKVIHSQYFNAVGILGWYFTGNLLGKQTIPGGQMTIYNKLVPVIKMLDKIIFNKIGLSVVVVGQKQG